MTATLTTSVLPSRSRKMLALFRAIVSSYQTMTATVLCQPLAPLQLFYPPPPASKVDDKPPSAHEQNQGVGIHSLPLELLCEIFDYLPGESIKNLRLTSSFFRNNASLRLGRIFLSCNARDMEVFQAISEHEVLRHRVKELIWDDTILSSPGECLDEEDFTWFEKLCMSSFHAVRLPKSDTDTAKSRHPFTRRNSFSQRLNQSWSHYLKLYNQAKVSENSNTHNLLADRLHRFPALKRITLTPASHGRALKPLYQTPTIRSMPKDLLYPKPLFHSSTDVYGWGGFGFWDDPFGYSRGYAALMEALQETTNHNVTEVCFDASRLDAGIPTHLFSWPGESYLAFETMISAPSFRRLHLDLTVHWAGICDMEPGESWRLLRKGLLARAIEGASGGKGLEHLSLGTDMHVRCSWMTTDDYSAQKDHIPLQSIIPISSVKRVKHFGLRGMIVKIEELLELLSALPDTLQTVELSFIEFFDGCYADLLTYIKDELGWDRRRSKPRVSISIPLEHHVPGRGRWLDDEVNGFLYDEGQNPFERPRDMRWGYIERDEVLAHKSQGAIKGLGVMRDALDPEWTGPIHEYESFESSSRCHCDRGSSEMTW